MLSVSRMVGVGEGDCGTSDMLAGDSCRVPSTWGSSAGRFLGGGLGTGGE